MPSNSSRSGRKERKPSSSTTRKSKSRRPKSSKSSSKSRSSTSSSHASSSPRDRCSSTSASSVTGDARGGAGAGEGAGAGTEAAGVAREGTVGRLQHLVAQLSRTRLGFGKANDDASGSSQLVKERSTALTPLGATAATAAESLAAPLVPKSGSQLLVLPAGPSRSSVVLRQDTKALEKVTIGETGIADSLKTFLQARGYGGAGDAEAGCCASDKAGDSTMESSPPTLKHMIARANHAELSTFLMAVTEHEEKVCADAKSVAQANMCLRAGRRMPALVITMVIELLVAFQISRYQATLTHVPLLISFMPVISALSGNVGLQSSSITTRALSHGFVLPRRWYRQIAREFAAAIFLGLATGALLGAVSILLFKAHLGFGIVIFIACLSSMLTASITGTAAPLIFSAMNIDPTSMAGPLETAVQDVVGNSCFLAAAVHLLKYLQ